MIAKFKAWWNKPLKPKDRLTAILIGAMGFFWVGIIGLFVFGPTPVSFSTLGYWAVGSIIIGVILGALFPKLVTIILFPFSLFSIGGS